MKTTKIILSSLLAMTILGTTIISCKKKKKDEPVASCSDKIKNQGETEIDCGGPCPACIPDDTEEQKGNSNDETDVSNETDAVVDDASNALPKQNAGKTDGANKWTTPCSATVDTTTNLKNLQVTITYDGMSCDGKRKRVGTVTITLTDPTIGNKPKAFSSWKSKGAYLTIEFNLFVTKISTGKTFKIVGTKKIVNVDGGSLQEMTTSSPAVTLHITGDVNVTLNDTSAGKWTIDRTRKIQYVGTDLRVTNTGGANNIAVSGTSKKGEAFTVSIPTAVVWSKSTCPEIEYKGEKYPKWVPISGVKIHKAKKELTVTFGVDKDGKSVASGCPHGYKLEWVNGKGVAKSLVLPY